METIRTSGIDYSCPAQVGMLASKSAGELLATTSEPPALVMMVAKGPGEKKSEVCLNLEQPDPDGDGSRKAGARIAAQAPTAKDVISNKKGRTGKSQTPA